MRTSSEVGLALKAGREQRNWTVERTSREARISTRQLLAIERGAEPASVAVLQRVARALGLSLANLVRGGRGPERVDRNGRDLDPPAIGKAIAELPDRLGSKVDAAVDAAVLHAMNVSGNNQSESARLLAMDRKKFIRRLVRARRRRRQ